MNEILLYPHNEVAYEKVMKTFETAERTCICHPTGTGKSYIVAAVCKNFKNILILAPNIFILNQQKNVIGEDRSVKYMTYPGLLSKVWSIKTRFDLIILDEFHRAGAAEWGAAVNLLLESQNQAKILGTSATYIRYLDGERDMAQELFKNNIASKLTIADAWNQNILPIPTYVTGFFSFDKIVANATEHIENSKVLSNEEKSQRIFRLSNMRIAWERSSGMVPILKKHITADTKRIIVFCAHIENLKEMSCLIKKWFKKAGLTVSNIYMLHSKQTSSEQLRQMRRFSSDQTKGIKIMLSVNILNEGVHISNVNAIMMLRTTSSPIIYMQQLGRCLTASNTENTVVLDMVDNITTTTVVSTALNELKKDVLINNRGSSKSKAFEIYDYTLDVREMVDRLSRLKDYNNSITIENRLEIIKKFCEEHRHLPTRVKDGKAHIHYNYMQSRCSNCPEFIALKIKYTTKHSIENRLEKLQKFIEENGFLPLEKDVDDYVNWVNIQAFKSKHKKDKELKSIIIAIDKIQRTYSKYGKSDERIKEEFFKFIKQHNRLPLVSKAESKEEKYLRNNIVRHRLHEIDPEIKKLWEKYSVSPANISLEENILNMQKFIDKHKRKPKNNEPEYIRWKYILQHAGKDERVIKMKEEHGGRRLSDNEIKLKVQQILDFYKENGQLPTLKCSPSLHYVWKNLKKNHSTNDDVQKLIALKS